MGTFTFNGGTPKKILYKGVEVKKILFNGVEVWWHKAIEAGSKSVAVERGQTKTLSFTVPDGVTRLEMNGNGYSIGLFTVTPGETVNFTFHSFETGYGQFNTEYSFNGSSKVVIGGVRTITIAWSEEINRRNQ